MAFAKLSELVTTYSHTFSDIDLTNGFLYSSDNNTSPGKITKIRLSDFTQNAILTTTSAENPGPVVVDQTGGYLYVGFNTGKRIAKISLSTFTEVGTIASTNTIWSSCKDLVNRFIYFGETAGRIDKINLSTFTKVNLNTGVNSTIYSAIIDTIGGYAYFGTSNSTIIRVRLSDFTVQGTISAGIGALQGSIIDTVNGFVYFAGYWPGSIAKIRLSDFTLISTLSPSPDGYLVGGVIDIARQYAYFCGYTNTSTVVQIDLTSFTRKSNINITTGPGMTDSLNPSIDLVNDVAYFPSRWANRVIKIDINVAVCVPNWQCREPLDGYETDTNNCGEPPRLNPVCIPTLSEVGTLTLSDSVNGHLTTSIDPVNGFIYGGCNGGDYNTGFYGKLVKIRISDFTQVDSISSGSSYKTCSAIDLTNGYFYTGSEQSPPLISKVWLPAFTEVATLSIGEGYTINKLLVDESDGFLYASISMSSGPDKIKKIDLTSFTVVSTLLLNSGENVISAIIDTVNKFAYYGVYTTPGSVVKIDLTTFTRVGKVTFNSGEGNPFSAIIDVNRGFAYFGTDDTIGKVVKINLSTFARDSSISFTGYEGPTVSAVIDTTDNLAYFLCRNSNYCVRIDLNTFTRATSIPLSFSPSFNSILYQNGKNIFSGASIVANSPSRLAKMVDTIITAPICNPTYVCEQPLNCYESDGCTNRLKSLCCPCSSITISSDKNTDIIGGIIRLTSSIQPIGQPFTTTFKINNTHLSHCIVSTIDGTCFVDWDTTGLPPGSYDATAEVVDSSCTTTSPITITLTSHCYGISLSIDRPSEFVGETIRLIATIQPIYQSLPVLFKINNTPLLPISTCNTSDIDGTCSVNWDTTNITPGTYDVTAEVTGQCTNTIQVTLAAPKIILPPNTDLWPKFKGDSTNSGLSPLAVDILTLTPLWTLQIGTGPSFTASPIIDKQGNIYIGSDNGNFYALNSDGTQRWVYPTNGAIRNSAIIDGNDNIYVGSTDSYLYALNYDGTLKWSFNTNQPIFSSPNIANGVIYVTTGYPGLGVGNLYAIYSDGTLKWSIGEFGLYVQSSPAISPLDGTIYFGSGTNSKLIAVNPDGTIKWMHITDSADSVYSSPAVSPLDGSVYFCSHHLGAIIALNPDGTRRWQVLTINSPGDSPIFSSPTIGNDGTIYIMVGRGLLYAINPDGSIKWTYDTGVPYQHGTGNMMSSPIIDANGNIFVGWVDGKIYSFSPDGTILWNYTIGQPIFSTPTLGSLYIAGGGGTLWDFGLPILGSYVKSSTLTVDTNDCVEPCTINGGVSWTNYGSSASLPIDLSITYNGNSILVSPPGGVIIAPGETKSYIFTIPVLTAGTYTVSASPNTGTTPQTITVRTPANIVATTINPSKTTCTEPCNDLTIDVTWTNNGGSTSPFIPSININGPIPLPTSVPVSLPSESLDPGQFTTRTFSLPNLTEGTYNICPSPNPDSIPCTTIDVTKMVELGAGGNILTAGLASGIILLLLDKIRCMKGYKSVEMKGKKVCIKEEVYTEYFENKDNYKKIVDVLIDGNNRVREIVINDNNKIRKIFTEGADKGKHR